MIESKAESFVTLKRDGTAFARAYITSEERDQMIEGLTIDRAKGRPYSFICMFVAKEDIRDERPAD